MLQWFVRGFSGLSCPAADLLIIQSLTIQSFSLLRTNEANLVIESSMGHNGLVCCCLESVSFLEVLLLQITFFLKRAYYSVVREL